MNFWWKLWVYYINENVTIVGWINFYTIQDDMNEWKSFHIIFNFHFGKSSVSMCVAVMNKIEWVEKWWHRHESSSSWCILNDVTWMSISCINMRWYIFLILIDKILLEGLSEWGQTFSVEDFCCSQTFLPIFSSPSSTLTMLYKNLTKDIE